MELDELTERVTKLKALLDDPQPGLMSWAMMPRSGNANVLATRYNPDAGHCH